MTPGHYADANSLISDMNDLIKIVFSKPIQQWSQDGVERRVGLSSWPIIMLNERNMKVYVTLPEYTELDISNKLASMLGFKRRQVPLTNNTSRAMPFRSRKAVDIYAGVHAMFIYCDLLECVPVGDTLSPLLRIINVNGSFGSNIQHYFEKPRYIPLQKKHFDSVEIDIRDDTGEPIAFETGKLIVTLHLKRARGAYYLA